MFCWCGLFASQALLRKKQLLGGTGGAGGDAEPLAVLLD